MTDLQALKRDLKKETTLAQVALEPEKADHSLLFGIVIDVSEAQKYKEKDNYTVSLKIIDPSFNYQQEVKNKQLKFHKFVKINFYGEVPESLPTIRYIGDIVRLRRFRFLYTNKGALIGNMQKYSNWLVYPGANFKERDIQCDPWTPLQHMKIDQNKNRELYDYEQGRLQDLRKWSISFFQQNSLMYIDWWNNFKQTEEDEQQINGVDLFLRIGNIEPKKKKFTLYDIQENQYELKLQSGDIKTLNHIIKLRCVNVYQKKNQKTHQKKFKVEFTNKTSSIFLPSYSMDYKKFFQSTSDKQTHNLLQFYDWLANYNLEDIQVKNNKITPKKHQKQKVVTTYKKIVSSKLHTVKQLQNILNKPSMHKNERFTIEGRIVSFSEDNPKKFLKVLQIQSKKFFNFGSIKLDGNMDKKYRVFLHLQVQVMDDTAKKPLDIYISTTEGDHHLFETWEIIPPSDRILEWSKLSKNELKRFQTSLQQLKKPQNKVKLCLQLMITSQGKSFFKLVDTIFLPL